MQRNRHPIKPGNNLIFSYSLIALQFAFIGILIFFIFIQTPYVMNVFALTIQILSGFIALWAVLHLQHNWRINILPDPRTGATLVQTGPYQYIRHPMYFSILLFFTTSVVSQPTPDSILVLVLLFAVLIYKLHYEEQLLVEQVMGYRKYQREAKKLIPFIY